MKRSDITADLILEHTLQELRRRKKIRRNRRAASACGVVVLGLLLTLPREHPAPPVYPSSADKVNPNSPPIEPEKLVTMVWRGGSPSLEEVEAGQLGDVELQFDLQPVITYGDFPFGGF